MKKAATDYMAKLREVEAATSPFTAQLYDGGEVSRTADGEEDYEDEDDARSDEL